MAHVLVYIIYNNNDIYRRGVYQDIHQNGKSGEEKIQPGIRAGAETAARISVVDYYFFNFCTVRYVDSIDRWQYWTKKLRRLLDVVRIFLLAYIADNRSFTGPRTSIVF